MKLDFMAYSIIIEESKDDIGFEVNVVNKNEFQNQNYAFTNGKLLLKESNVNDALKSFTEFVNFCVLGMRMFEDFCDLCGDDIDIEKAKECYDDCVSFLDKFKSLYNKDTPVEDIVILEIYNDLVDYVEQ